MFDICTCRLESELLSVIYSRVINVAVLCKTVVSLMCETEQLSIFGGVYHLTDANAIPPRSVSVSC